MCSLRIFENLSRSILPESVFYFVWILNSYTALIHSIVFEAVVALFFTLSWVSLAVKHYFILFFFFKAAFFFNFTVYIKVSQIVLHTVLQCTALYYNIFYIAFHCRVTIYYYMLYFYLSATDCILHWFSLFLSEDLCLCILL